MRNFPRIASTLLRPGRVISILAALCVVYFAGLHPWFMNWGATPFEQAAALPGDYLLPQVSSRFTRAITIHAPVSVVWQWIVQIGQERAGFYSNTWLENLTGADIHNAAVIHAEWQQRSLGDRVLLARPDLLGGAFAKLAQTRIVALEPERLIANIPGRFVLQPLDSAATRLLLRESVPVSPAARISTALIWDPIHFVMQQRMLRGIKERAEDHPLVPGKLLLVARIGWIVASIALLAAFLARRGRRLGLVLPLAMATPALRWAGDWDAAMASFLAVGITVLGAIEFGRRWWSPYFLLAAAVALILLLSPDPYTAFGITFTVLAGTALAAVLIQRTRGRTGTAGRRKRALRDN